MTALLFVEVIDTAGVLLDAILWWIVIAAFVATVCIYTAVLTGAWAWRAVRRGHTPASPPQPVPCGSCDAGTPPRPAGARTAPSWAHDKEAA